MHSNVWRESTKDAGRLYLEEPFKLHNLWGLFTTIEWLLFIEEVLRV